MSGLHHHQVVRLAGDTDTDPIGEHSHLQMLSFIACCSCQGMGLDLGFILGMVLACFTRGRCTAEFQSLSLCRLPTLAPDQPEGGGMLKHQHILLPKGPGG